MIAPVLLSSRFRSDDPQPICKLMTAISGDDACPDRYRGNDASPTATLHVLSKDHKIITEICGGPAAVICRTYLIRATGT